MADFFTYYKSGVWQSNRKEAKSSGEHIFFRFQTMSYLLFSETTDPKQL